MDVASFQQNLNKVCQKAIGCREADDSVYEVSNGIKDISDKLSAALVTAESENAHNESKKVTLCVRRVTTVNFIV